MARFNLADYETVESRLVRFWEANPDGRIATELVAAEGGRYIVKAEVYRSAEDIHAVATGYAEETIGSSPVNKTSALENCETSAIGRALANWTFQAKGAPRPSREEMSKVAGRDVRVEVASDKATTEQTDLIKAIAEEVGLRGDDLRDAIAAAAGREVKGYGDIRSGEVDEIIATLQAAA